MYDQKTFSGGVVSRTIATGTVQHPVVITLDGISTELPLSDANKLRDGLLAAIATVDASNLANRAAQAGHHFTIGRTKFEMSAVP